MSEKEREVEEAKPTARELLEDIAAYDCDNPIAIVIEEDGVIGITPQSARAILEITKD